MFDEFLIKVKQCWAYRGERRLISIKGHSSFGKTVSLKLLGSTLNIDNTRSLYLDLAQREDLVLLSEAMKKLDDEAATVQTILLLDNAQKYDMILRIEHYSLIVAAFSPQMEIKDKSDKTPEKWLMNKLGTKNITFYACPFLLSDVHIRCLLVLSIRSPKRIHLSVLVSSKTKGSQKIK